MQPEPILPFLPGIGRFKLPCVVIGFLQILQDGAGFGEDLTVIFNNGRFSKRVDFFQRLWRKHGFFTLVANNLVGQRQLLQRPEHALGTRLIQMMHRQHGCLLFFIQINYRKEREMA